VLNSVLPSRPLEEQMAGEVRVSLGGRTYVMPVLTRRQNRAWKAAMEERLGSVVGGIQGSSDPATIMRVLSTSGDTVPELVRLYDQSGVLPDDDDPALEYDTDIEWLRALLAVASAAYPFVGLALEAQRLGQQQTPPAPTNGHGPEPMSSPPTSMAGRRSSSKPS
jgi:hypothetical protein